MTDKEARLRQQFLEKLKKLNEATYQKKVENNVSFRNDIDNTSPPANFDFIAESVLGPGVEKVSEEFMIGCSCRKKRASLACKYPNECLCLQDSMGDGARKSCPYADTGPRKGCLVHQYLKSRYHVFECNSKCDCFATCKSRVVQHKRKIRLEIFKTDTRGWGLRTMDDLKRGQFVDTYRGEILTTADSDARSENRGPEEDNYMFGFDKFTDEPLYVCDGKYKGGPSRFINHSCAPNCRLFTVSYNHADSNIYELAFFAINDIPKDTELTFDYLDQEQFDDELGRNALSGDLAKKHEEKYGYRPSKCRCGSANCRGYFFFLGDE